MFKSLATLTPVLVLAGTLVPQPVSKQHEYTVSVRGRKGIELDMLLVTRESRLQPLKKETARVKLPYEHKFEASEFYIWFDTPGSHLEKTLDQLSGEELIVYAQSEGEDIEGEYQRDGRRIHALEGQAGFAGKIRLGEHTSLYFGDL